MASSDNASFQRTISALVQDRPGVLARIAGLFRRRGFNIASLAVGRSEQPGLSRMTFVVEGPNEVVRHVSAQLDRLIDVVEVRDITEKNIVWRELALIKVTADALARREILELVNIFRVNVIDIGAESLTVEISGGRQKIDSFIELVRKFGIEEVIRTGRVATLRGTLIAGEVDGLFQSDTNQSNYTLPIPGDDTGSV
ncbi:MAG: acetolactate synthase small subunit [SAR202 cluster bacterium]|jgi:acetolactate synthase-1/3 small subunit|nr:MAG: acetolactate synthase small subunit [SAR202 cluster bacterium]MCH2529797.1 acetolactate synthase small subunit [Dehalococcoidia bacterium]MQF64047.1 acetolactate synthase small subunit [SAR202 cluster bacterium AD-802-L14_MRT_200m]KAA1300648.1 MAG: acetolactate synthase small subunit [SAR202 cluster bacterium]KAA1301341.1 MAG: acetolactate synthase small subunit [SAR202 cluster bacterium]